MCGGACVCVCVCGAGVWGSGVVWRGELGGLGRRRMVSAAAGMGGGCVQGVCVGR